MLPKRKVNPHLDKYDHEKVTGREELSDDGDDKGFHNQPKSRSLEQQTKNPSHVDKKKAKAYQKMVREQRPAIRVPKPNALQENKAQENKF